HIKPLGSPHYGRDRRDNILCLCPNCHAKLDFGVIELDSRKINCNAQQHTIGIEFVDYHNSFIFRKL
ncbi:MAG: HNH endonuclease, partial [Planctomycetes bacterium]|nr:HNH endonuclease [Planctomycetota bacterium]